MAPPADLILTGGSIFTADAARRFAEALAVRNGRIVAVGTAREVREWIGPPTRVLELEGRTVVPGFQDAHIHGLSGGVAQLGCALWGTRSREECLDAIARYAAEHPERDWIVGDGWSLDSFEGGTPLATDLDAIVPGRPVYVESRDGHTGWASSRALELAGITAATPDPPGGRIERDKSGGPSGALQEDAINLVLTLVPEPTSDELERGLLLAQAEAHRFGITAWQEAKLTGAMLDAYLAVAGRGELTMRTEGNLWWSHARGGEQLDELLALRTRGTLGRLRIRGAKLFADGVIESFTAGVLEPHTNGAAGLMLYEAAHLAHVVALLDADGFQVQIHAIGDRAVRESLDAFEAALAANGRREARHHICHVQLVHPDDRPRFRRLGVVANCQPLWAVRSGYVDDLTLPFLSETQAATLYPFGSLHGGGAMLAFGSDWTVSTQDPLPQIEVAVNRVHPEEREAEPLLPDERLPLPDALAAFTIGSAYVNHLDGETGSLEPGKLADLAVIDRDLFDRGAGGIADASVVLTLVEGEPVWAEPALGW